MIEEVVRFRSDVRMNPKVAQVVLAQGTNLEAIADVGRVMGYNFTFEEFEAEVTSRMREALDDGELASMGAKWATNAHPQPSPTTTSAWAWANTIAIAETIAIVGIVN